MSWTDISISLLTQFFSSFLQDFGTTHWYEADGWFTQSTGPWQAGNSTKPPAPSSPAAPAAPPPPCVYSAAQPNTYLGNCVLNCQSFSTLAAAQAACSANYSCGGVTVDAKCQTLSRDWTFVLVAPAVSHTCHSHLLPAAREHESATLAVGRDVLVHCEWRSVPPCGTGRGRQGACRDCLQVSGMHAWWFFYNS